MKNDDKGLYVQDAWDSSSIAVIVAHPDDETLWCGGTLLMHANSDRFIVCLCRGEDADRAPKFKKALSVYGAQGIMGDLDDGPEQIPLNKDVVKEAVLDLLPKFNFDLIITHDPFGEYTRHLRHEEIGEAVIGLWEQQKIRTKELWTFAYSDGNEKCYPRAIPNADRLRVLPMEIWKEKYRLITEVYGFGKSGFEARTTPRKEAFWKFGTPVEAKAWLKQGGSYNRTI